MFGCKYRDIGLKIAYYRKKRGLTQAQLADMIGKSTNYIWSIERGNGGASYSMQTLFSIAKALDVPPEDLVKGKL